MKIHGPYYDTNDATGLGAPSGIKDPVSDTDTGYLDELLKGKDKVEDKVDDEDKSDDEDIIPEEDELEVDKKEPEEAEEPEDDLIPSNRGVDLKKIKEKYPEFAKTNEFRELRNAYYRESKYTDLFPTVEDAQEAAENNDTFNKLNDGLVNKGEVSTLFDALKSASPESLKKVVSGFLPSLAKYDESLYADAITPIVKNLARRLNRDGKRILAKNSESEDGQALVATARNIMHHIFDDPDLVDKDDPAPDPKLTAKEKEIEEREKAILRSQYEDAFGTVVNSVEKNLDKRILDGLDPDESLTEFTRDALVEKIRKDVQKQLGADIAHNKRMDSLWNRAAKEGFNRESLSRIATAYLERARPIISTSRAKFRSMALGKTRSKPDEDTGEERKSLKIPNRGTTPRTPGKVNLREISPKKVDWNKTSDNDIFEGKVAFRGK